MKIENLSSYRVIGYRLSVITILILFNSAAYSQTNTISNLCEHRTSQTSILSGNIEKETKINLAKIPELNSEDSIIYDTGCPKKQPTYGYDLFSDVNIPENQQTVAIRFTPDENYQLSSISLWIMNNSGDYKGNVKLSLREDKIMDDYTLPSDESIYTWTIEEISSGGWVPELEIVHVNEKIKLKANKNYWLVAESDAPIYENPIWNISSSNTQGYMTNTDKGEWMKSGYVAPVSVTITGKIKDF